MLGNSELAAGEEEKRDVSGLDSGDTSGGDDGGSGDKYWSVNGWRRGVAGVLVPEGAMKSKFEWEQAEVEEWHHVQAAIEKKTWSQTLTMPPKGTAHRRRQPQSTSTTSKENLPSQKPCTTEELQGLEEKIAKQFNWKDGPKVFQMDGIKAQLQMRDALIHAGTGLGKTAVAAGPHVHPSAKGKVTIMVSPLIALHDEMVST